MLTLTHFPVDSRRRHDFPDGTIVMKRKRDTVTQMMFRLNREHPEDRPHLLRQGMHHIDSVQTTGNNGMRGNPDRMSIWTDGGQGPTATTRPRDWRENTVEFQRMPTERQNLSLRNQMKGMEEQLKALVERNRR